MGAAMIVSLIEEHEFGELEIEALPERVAQLGMQWRHLPICDNQPPARIFNALWPTVGAEIITLLKAGQRVFLHCKGGLGRTGTVAACLLIESGISPEEAVKRVRAARRNTIEAALQAYYVLSYRPMFAFHEPPPDAA